MIVSHNYAHTHTDRDTLLAWSMPSRTVEHNKQMKLIMDTNISIICQAARNRRQNNRKRGTSNLNRIKSKTPFESNLNLFTHTYSLYKVFETHSQPVSTIYMYKHTYIMAFWPKAT